MVRKFLMGTVYQLRFLSNDVRNCMKNAFYHKTSIRSSRASIFKLTFERGFILIRGFMVLKNTYTLLCISEFSFQLLNEHILASRAIRSVHNHLILERHYLKNVILTPTERNQYHSGRNKTRNGHYLSSGHRFLSLDTCNWFSKAVFRTPINYNQNCEIVQFNMLSTFLNFL